MAGRRWKVGKMELVIFKSEKWVLLSIAVVIVFSTAALAALGWAMLQFRSQTQSLHEQAGQLEYENGILERNIAEIGSIKSTERIAREELGMVSPDTILIEAQVK